ncbi:hypothetical protein HY468_05275 [Candidatus Roizmanbacteria bacterium]|nr:hypothetical protein [Candidatus Roizmanbacteria bacterium]
MNNPYLTAKGHARAYIIIQTSSSRESVDCMIDTGFSSGIALNTRLQNRIPKQLVAAQEFELADGSIILANVYKIAAQFKNTELTTLGIFTNDGDNLLGIEFLKNFTFVLALKKNMVSLE